MDSSSLLKIHRQVRHHVDKLLLVGEVVQLVVKLVPKWTSCLLTWIKGLLLAPRSGAETNELGLLH